MEVTHRLPVKPLPSSATFILSRHDEIKQRQGHLIDFVFVVFHCCSWRTRITVQLCKKEYVEWRHGASLLLKSEGPSPPISGCSLRIVVREPGTSQYHCRGDECRVLVVTRKQGCRRSVLLREGDSQVLADLPRQLVNDLGMAWNGRPLVLRGIQPPGVAAPFPNENTSPCAEMFQSRARPTSPTRDRLTSHDIRAIMRL